MRTRAEPLGFEVIVGNPATELDKHEFFGVLLQYPASTGEVVDYAGIVAAAHAKKALVVVAADLLALTLLKSPGELGADVAIGTTQRFGIPLGFGGPHAAYFATLDAHKRVMPGRVVGVSIDSHGKKAYRLAMQTRAPIVPVAVIGAEEQAPAIADIKPLARLFGFPSMPLIFPHLLPLPLPVKYRIWFGEPMEFKGSADEDDDVVAGHVKKVKHTIQRMITHGLEKRTGLFF